MNILVVVFGCFNRSLHLTHDNHVDNIFKPLETNGVEYDMLYVNNRVNKIDGVDVSTREKIWASFVDSHTIVEYTQQHAFQEIEDTHQIDKIFTVPWYNNIVRKRAALNSYIETVTSIAMSRNKHDHAIVFCSDLWFDKNINLDWLSNTDVMVGDQNPGSSGLTNGFYCGGRKNITSMLDTFYNTSLLSQRCDYERMLKLSATQHDVLCVENSYRFLKIRGNGSIAYKTDEKFLKENPTEHRTRLWNRIKHIEADYRGKCE